jgi:hypothetical protein
MMRPAIMDRIAPDDERSADQARPIWAPPQAARRRDGPTPNRAGRPTGSWPDRRLGLVLAPASTSSNGAEDGSLPSGDARVLVAPTRRPRTAVVADVFQPAGAVRRRGVEGAASGNPTVLYRAAAAPRAGAWKAYGKVDDDWCLKML